MAEQIRSVKVTVEVDTNKATYARTFESMDEAQAWYEGLTWDVDGAAGHSSSGSVGTNTAA